MKQLGVYISWDSRAYWTRAQWFQVHRGGLGRPPVGSNLMYRTADNPQGGSDIRDVVVNDWNTFRMRPWFAPKKRKIKKPEKVKAKKSKGKRK